MRCRTDGVVCRHLLGGNAVKTDHTDATGDYGYLLKEAEDAMYLHITEKLYAKTGPRAAFINGKAVLMDALLFEATDITGAPDGARVMRYMMDQAIAGDMEATGILDGLIAAYAKANAIAPE